MQPFMFVLVLETALVQAPGRPGLSAYVDGLDALEQARWTEAIGSFSKALEDEEENADYFLARGVAEALGEKLEAAQRDLDRANRLRPGHAPTRMWLATVVDMQGRLSEGSTIFPAATRDPYEAAVRGMSYEYGHLLFARPEDRSDPKIQQKHRNAIGKFATLARQFVQRTKSADASIGGALKQRGVARYKNRQYAAALIDLEHARRTDPADLDVIFAAAGCKLELGFFEGARADYTIVLTQNVKWAEAYLGRALALAELGSAARAREDFALGEKLDPPAAAARKEELQRRLAQSARPLSAEDRQQLLTSLYQSARNGAGQAELRQRALALVKAVAATRLRADERYQLRLRELREAVERTPRDAGPLADLGQFLYDEATTVLSEWVEPRSTPRPYRPQTNETRQAELAEAEAVLDRSLQLDPQHVKALAFKAACLTERLQWGDAETLLKRALSLRSDDPIVLGMFSRVMDHAAATKAAAASNLRQTRTWEDWHYIYFRYPSQAERQRADEYEAQAKQLWLLAKQALQSAANAARGTARGCYFQAVIAEREGDIQAARTALETGVRLQHDDLASWQRLAQIYGKLGMTNEAYEAQLTAANFTHTTAAAMLKLAWMYVDRTRWKSASQALDRGAATDPADPRIAAYCGVIARQKEQAAEAMGWFRTAAAINESQFLLRGLRLDETTGPTLQPEDAGLEMALDNAAAEFLLEAKQPQLAEEALGSSLAMYGRMEVADRYTRVAAAMLPQPQDDTFTVPEAPNVETLQAWSRLRLGEALLAQKRFDEALGHWQWVADFETRKPAVLDVGGMIWQPRAEAVVRMAKAYFDRGDQEKALQYVRQAGAGPKLSPALKAELEKVSQQLEAGRLQQQRAEVQRWQNPVRVPAQQQQNQVLEYQRRSLLQRKQYLQQFVNNPNIPAQQKQWAQQSIQQIEQTLSRLEQTQPQVGSGQGSASQPGSQWPSQR